MFASFRVYPLLRVSCYTPLSVSFNPSFLLCFFYSYLLFFFFFQAEDGIRDGTVTGVQTCALPIFGLSSGCSPVLDLVFSTTSAVIGARSFGPDPDFIAALGREVVDGLLETGNMPVMKHIPGHGRATLDSHKERPIVDASRETLEATDFKPFVALKDTPWAMVAHVVYSAYDKELPASISPVMHDVIRKDMGYDGVLISDCIFMESLRGTLPERVAQVLDGGFDIALHSHGDVKESEAAAKAARPLTEAAQKRIA